MARATARRSDRPTARNAARRGFRGLDDRLQLVIEAADLAFWDWDVASGRVDWGGHRFGLLERRPRASEATYEAFLRLVHADDRQALSDAIARAFEKGETFRCEFRIVGTGEDAHWMRAQGRACRDGSGRVVRMIGVVRDITEYKIADDARREAQHQEQIILDSVPAFIWYKDRENRILRVNAPAAASMGTTVADIEGRSTYDVYPEEAEKYHRDDLQVIESGEAKLGIVEQLLTGTGEKRWVRTDKIPYRDERGKIVGVIVFAVDITEQKRAEEALGAARDALEARVEERTRELAAAIDDLRREAAERRRAEEQTRRQEAELAHILRLRTVEGMAAELAHEMNQPLAAIMNYANGLAARLGEGPVDAAAMRDAAEQIAKQAERAAEVIRWLRDLVRKDPPKKEFCDVNRVAREAVGLIEADAGRHSVRVRLALQPRIPRVEIDRIQIEQVVINLLRNALEAMAECGSDANELRVTTSFHPRTGVVFEVRDTGIGVSADIEQRLFEAFFTTKPNGLGMGLSISRSIVEAHGGTLWAAGNDDRGATFGFNIPVARDG